MLVVRGAFCLGALYFAGISNLLTPSGGRSRGAPSGAGNYYSILESYFPKQNNI